MPAVNLIWPMWDGETPRYVGAPYGGIRVKEGFLAVEAYNSITARIPTLAMAGFQTRAKTLLLSGYILQSLDGTSGAMISEIYPSLTLNAIEYNSEGTPDAIDQSLIVPVADEIALSRFAGWYGYSANGSLNGGAFGFWIGGEIYRWGTTDENGRTTADECTFYPPHLYLYMNSVPSSVSDTARMGQGTIYDNCPIVCTLPATENGSFDGTGCTGFTMQIGVPGSPPGEDFGRLTGGLTLTVTEWWEHGGRYDASTGETL